MKNLDNNNIVHIKGKDCEYIQFRRLLNYSNIRHAYSLKPENFRTAGTNVDSIQQENSIANYKKLCNSISVDYNTLIKPNQCHTGNVKSVLEKSTGMSLGEEKYSHIDALTTNKTGVTLATTNADCILLMFYDPKKHAIANAHSGWRGTFKKISQNVVENMKREYGSNPKDIICCICPSIRKCHFEVEKDVKDLCEETFAYTGKLSDIIEYVGQKQGRDKWLIDTVLINKIILQEVGLLPENIIDSGICSVCNSDVVHSYRVEKEGYGLGTAIISMVK